MSSKRRENFLNLSGSFSNKLFMCTRCISSFWCFFKSSHACVEEGLIFGNINVNSLRKENIYRAKIRAVYSFLCILFFILKRAVVPYGIGCCVALRSSFLFQLSYDEPVVNLYNC